MSDNNAPSTVAQDVESNKNKAASYEDAIRACGFGKFNFILLAIAIPGAFSAVFDNTVISYVLPVAQCDLALSQFDNGMLNSSQFIGTILSGFFWGFLADTLGRRNILIYSYLIDSLLNILCTFLENVWFLFTIKVLTGVVICGPVAVVMSYLSEFHSVQYRAKILAIVGVSWCTAGVVLPLLAWCILPISDMRLGIFVIHSWQLYIIICTIPITVSGLGHFYLPESPKFLLASGGHVEALTILQNIYAMNTGKPAESFPIKQLIQEGEIQKQIESKQKSYLIIFKEGFQAIGSLFYPPTLWIIIMILLIQFGMYLSANTLRLWLPQLFMSMDAYRQDSGRSTVSLCEITDYQINATNANITIAKVCSVIVPNDEVYLNSVIVGSASVLANILIIPIIDRFDKKYILAIILLIAGCSGFGIYWTSSTMSTLILSAIYNALTIITLTSIVSIIVDIFSVKTRTFVISTTMTFGRLGCIVGNLVFPLLLEFGCLPALLLLGIIPIVCVILLVLLPASRCIDT